VTSDRNIALWNGRNVVRSRRRILPNLSYTR